MRYRFAEMIEKSLNVVFLCEMTGCTIIICFLEFGVLKVLLLIKIIGIKYGKFYRPTFLNLLFVNLF